MSKVGITLFFFMTFSMTEQSGKIRTFIIGSSSTKNHFVGSTSLAGPSYLVLAFISSPEPKAPR